MISNLSSPGQDSRVTLSQNLVEEALIVSDLFKLNELSSLQLLLHGEEQLPQYPGLTRGTNIPTLQNVMLTFSSTGLVAVILYYDGRKALVQALKTLMLGRPGLTWSSEASSDTMDLVVSYTDSLVASGLVERILSLISCLDWTQDLSGLQKHAALGDPQHVDTVQLLHSDIKQNLADIIYCYSAQNGLNTPSVVSLIDHLAKTSPTTATGSLDNVNLALLMSCLASFDVSGAASENGNIPMVKDKDFISVVGRELEDRAGRKWETPGVLSVLQLAWSMALAGLRTGSVGAPHAATHLEEDEMFIDLALDNKVFHFIPNLLLTGNSFSKEEFYQRRLHMIITDFVSLMPLKIKELRNRADDAARNAVMHEQEGVQYNVPVAGQHFGQLLVTIAQLYINDPLDLALADLYWCDGGDIRHLTGKQVALHKFVRLAGDLLMPSLYVPYINMLTGIANTSSAAISCFSMLKMNDSDSTVSLDHFFSSLSQYQNNLAQFGQTGARPDMTIYRSSQPHTRGISPQEINGLSSVLDLVTVLAERSEQARLAMAEHPGWSVVPSVLGLLSCSVPSQIKAKLMLFLSALAKTHDIVSPLWKAVEAAGLIGGQRPGLVGELEEIEARQEEFPLTRAFLKLLNTLTEVEIPGNLGAGNRQPGFLPYLTFIQDQVFIKFHTRTYKHHWEKWSLAASCLDLLHKFIQDYQPTVEDFQNRPGQVGLAPGYYVMHHLHQTSLLLRTVLLVIDEARMMLDTFTPVPGKEKLEEAATAALKLLQTGLRRSESFINAGRTGGASTVLTSLSKLVLGVNPRSGRADHILNISKFVLFGYWMPAARLAAVNIIKEVGDNPFHQTAILATLTSTPATANMVIRAFTEALDSDDEGRADVPDSNKVTDGSMTKLVILDILQAGLSNMPAPSLSHFLLGFDLKKGISKSQLQPPSIAGIRTALHAILSLVAPAEPGVPTSSLSTSPHLVTACYKLVYTLVSSPLTSEPVLRYLRSSSYLTAQLATLGELMMPGDLSVHSSRAAAWLLRSVALEIRVLTVSRQHSQLARILGLLLDKVEQDESELGRSLYRETTYSQLSRSVVQTTNRHLETPASNHRLAAVLNFLDFEMEKISAPSWELFDDSQVSGVLEQCQVHNTESGSQEVLISIPTLHRILAMELATIQGSAALNQRALIQTEIEAILHYAVSWNRVQESAAARRYLLDSWREVAETLLSQTPHDLLPASSKQQILLQLLQTLLNKVASESLVSGMDTIVSSTVLLLMKSLRETYSSSPDKQDIMGDTFVGLLDNAIQDQGSTQLYSGSLQVVLRGLISWVLGAGAGSQVIRTNLYAALLAYLRIGKTEAGQLGRVLELSERGKLQKANLEVVMSYGTSLLEVLSRDATTGHEVRRMLALSVLDELIILDRQATTIRYLATHGFLKHLIESLTVDEEGLTSLLTKASGNIRYLYVYEAKVNILIRVGCNPVGAELLLQAGVMARLAEFSVLDLRPDPETSLLREADSQTMTRYHSVLFPVLRLCQAILASLGADNVSAASQTVHFLSGHEDLVSLILRGSNTRSSLHPALLEELALLSSVVSRAATLNLQTDALDASTLALQGQLARMQKQMLSLLHHFQMTESLVSTLQTSPNSPVVTLHVLQIISNVVSFSRSLVLSASANPRSTR